MPTRPYEDEAKKGTCRLQYQRGDNRDAAERDETRSEEPERYKPENVELVEWREQEHDGDKPHGPVMLSNYYSTTTRSFAAGCWHPSVDASIFTARPRASSIGCGFVGNAALQTRPRALVRHPSSAP